MDIVNIDITANISQLSTHNSFEKLGTQDKKERAIVQFEQSKEHLVAVESTVVDC